ncbi:MAG: DUF4366 domain-containing protein [Aeriscardovia sp.]|nr:DUF4366 domain-containing protein [Aeriscardovia sp.]
MRSKMFIRKKITKGLAAAGLFLCLFLTTVPVHAEEPATVASQTETAAEAKEETPDEVAVLPGGNLTLVDDVITADDAHREFLTVVSKDGSYFYIVIDRDTPGAGNVYFLNLVDNQDLYKLTGEKAPEVKEPETEAAPGFVPQKQEPEEEPDQAQIEEEAAKQKRKALMITVGFGAAIIVALVIYLLKKRKDKKRAQVEYDLSDFGDDDEE